jgi:F-type H+-transporting ATPase subunit alpha
VQRSHKGIYDAIRETGELSDDTATALKDAIEEFRRGFEIHGGEMLVKEEEPVEPLTEEDRDKVNKYVRRPEAEKPQEAKQPPAEKQ